MRSLRGADGLRAIACLMVIFHHFAQKINFDAVDPTIRAFGQFLITGASGVSVFFILSGFLLAMPFWEAWIDGRALPDLRVYAVRRAGRIMPGFYLNLLLCFFLGLCLFPDAPSVIWRYFAGLSFTASFHWLSFFPAEINGPLWSIGFEVVSYVLMPIGMVGLFALLGKKRSMPRGLLWWALVWVAMLGANQLVQAFFQTDAGGKGWQYGIVGGAKWWMPRYNPIGMFGHYSLGVMAAGLSLWWARSPKADTRRELFDIASLACFAAWLTLLISRAGQSDFSLNWQDQPYYFPLFPALTALLLACLTQSRLVGRIFDNPVARYLARISFGLYIWHYLIMWAATALFPDYSYGGIRDMARWAALNGLVLALSVGVASLSWYCYEQPILRRAQAWKPRPAGSPRRWTAFSRGVAVCAVLLLVVPPVAAAAIRPSAFGFPAPWFRPHQAAAAVPTGQGKLVAHIAGAKNAQGYILLSVYKQGSFAESDIVARSRTPAGPDLTVEFPDLAYGEYALVGMHDESGGGQLHMRGNIPVEGIIQAKKPIGPPEFGYLSFDFTHAGQTENVEVYYLQ